MGRGTTARAAALLATVLVTGVLGACSSDDPEARQLQRLPPVERDVETNPDRDAEAVLAAVTSVDPCLLLTDEAAVEVGDHPTTRRRQDPFSCRIGTVRTTVAEVVTGFGERARYHLGRHDAAGAVSYRGSTTRRDCAVHLPVSHDVALELRSWERPCADTITYAEAAAEVLQRRPGSVARGVDAPPPFSACELLSAVATEQSRLGSINGTLSGCSLSAGGSVTSTEARLILDHGTSTAARPGAHQVGGTTVTTDEVEGQCWLRWDLPGARDANGRVPTARLVTDTCTEARDLLAKVEPAARRPRPDAAPDGLLYPWSAAVDDVPSVGACVDVLDAVALECTPANPADVPADPEDLLEWAEADPDVLCTAAAPIVREHLGDELRAATSLAAPRSLRTPSSQVDATTEPATQCVFGEPTHAVHVTVRASTSQPYLTEHSEHVDLAGHPAVVAEARDPEGVVPFVRHAIGLGLDRPGGLRVEVQATPTREEGNWQGIAVDTTPVDEAEALAADLARTLLGTAG